MGTNTYDGNEVMINNNNDDLFSTASFEPEAIEILTADDVYGATADILEKEFESLYEIKQNLETSGATKSAVIFRDILWKILFRNNENIPTPFIILKESFHINRVYYDSYSSHLSAKHFPRKQYCKRLFFLSCPIYSDDLFDKSENELCDLLIGSCVIRPSLENENIIGQTLLNPKCFEKWKNEYICTASYKLTMFGKRVSLEAFPYMMQDGEVITCAETTLIHLLDYFSNRYSSYRSVVPSDLFEIEKELSFERIIPSKGMTYKTVSHLLTKLNFHPKLYGFDNNDTIVDKRTMHHYIDSAIPVAVSLNPGNAEQSHSIVAIGISKTLLPINKVSSKLKPQNGLYFLDISDLYYEYIVMNDSSAPYTKISMVTDGCKEKRFKFQIENTVGNFEISSIIAPLAKRMYLDDFKASEIALSFISNDNVGIKKAIEMAGIDEYSQLGLTKNDPILYRLFLVRAGSFRRKRSFNLKKKTLRWTVYSSIPLPKFVWVCELYSKSSLEKGKAIGEVVIDATASEMDGISSAIILNYPGCFSYRTPEESFDIFVKRYESNDQPTDWSLIEPYIHFQEPQEEYLENN